MKLYLAGSSADVPRARTWHAKLTAAGVEVTSTWLDVVAQVGNANPRTRPRADRYQWSMADLAEIDRADVLCSWSRGGQADARRVDRARLRALKGTW